MLVTIITGTMQTLGNIPTVTVVNERNTYKLIIITSVLLVNYLQWDLGEAEWSVAPAARASVTNWCTGNYNYRLLHKLGRFHQVDGHDLNQDVAISYGNVERF